MTYNCALGSENWQQCKDFVSTAPDAALGLGFKRPKPQIECGQRQNSHSRLRSGGFFTDQKR